jgi:hypothetical protein
MSVPASAQVRYGSCSQVKNHTRTRPHRVGYPMGTRYPYPNCHPYPTQTKVATPLPGYTIDVFSQVIPPLSPLSHRKRGRLFTDDARRCRRCVHPGMGAFGTMESGSFVEEEGPIRVPQSSCPSDALGACHVEDSPHARASLAHRH